MAHSRFRWVALGSGSLAAGALALLAPGAGLAQTADAGRTVSAPDAIRQEAPVRIWPEGAPAIPGWPGYDHPAVREQRQPGTDLLLNVTDPTYTAYLPAMGRARGAGVVIAPGGGFRVLDIAMCEDLAKWFAARGIAAFVLKYRTAPWVGDRAEMQKRLWEMRRNVPGKAGVADGLEALRLIRARAADYAVRPERVGVIGFSAGGHVAGMMAAASDPEARASFAGLIYGMPYEGDLIELPPANLPPTLASLMAPVGAPPPRPAPDRLPPQFLAMAQDDVAAQDGFRTYYDRLFAAGYRPELHLYAKGGHGFRLGSKDTTAARFAEQFVDWLEVEGFLAL
ncbi:alpha/beta hydrolase [Novosphingobium profundi]|uniref:alpha/beta hydrolase n=1 Tax=Novosphingobium profundi TaxID=1774954 RepID=UPI001BDB4DA3|nr:alpha/beta hydrolase [Novosphingobium profundi]MBT0669929.1 alpha/beta hydrolase [Novosphingobium profundi]